MTTQAQTKNWGLQKKKKYYTTNFVLINFLFLQWVCSSGPDCDMFEVSLPQTVEVLSGSCVTIPCSFEIQRKYEKHVHGSCKGLWVDLKSSDPRLTDTNPVMGNITEKDCTTTFYNIQPDHSNMYNFRLDCNNLKYTFKEASVKIDVKGRFLYLLDLSYYYYFFYLSMLHIFAC